MAIIQAEVNLTLVKPVKQSRVESLVETCLNVAIGFLVSCSVWPLVTMYLGIPYALDEAMGITLFFTILSVARGYIVRRWFNNGLHQAAINITRKILKD